MPHQQNDIIMKKLTETFSHDALHIFGIEGVELSEALPTELSAVESRRIDMAWRTAAGEVFHLEFQTKRESTLHRFLAYDVKLAWQYKTTVRTVVLYHQGVLHAPVALDIGTAQYHVENVYLGNFDGDGVLDSVEQDIACGQWTPNDRVQLSLALNMRFSRRTKEQAIDKVLALVERIPEPEERDLVCAALIGLTERALSESEWLRMKKEMMKMSEMAQEIYDDGRREGLQEGHQVGLQEGRQAGLQEGRQAGLQEGRQEGRQQEKLDIARRLLRDGLAVDYVAKCLQLSVDEINALKQQLDK
ncbi:Rpn family recombination-promoting nuclease/putative transposase [Alicyclobacillus fodiniaquatilis]|uniref:Rpn family recombination-promoting nuclease/putative transposase n=1 Tax=Alicyclobacillus fodiniaquatilis TaxID=1661150 RepID=A0ABW4JCR7_9BACL